MIRAILASWRAGRPERERHANIRRAARSRRWRERHCIEPATQDHMTGGGICPACGIKALRLGPSAPGAVVLVCGHCRGVTYA